MIIPTISAYVFSTLTGIVVMFQLALALGVPWGDFAMGGKFPGRLPLHMRIAALIQMVVLIIVALVVLIRAGIVFDEYFAYSKLAIWFVVALLSVGTLLNSITPSKKEKLVWAPVTLVMLVCSLLVATI